MHRDRAIPFDRPLQSQRPRDDNKNNICVFRRGGGGMGGERKIPRKRCFSLFCFHCAGSYNPRSRKGSIRCDQRVCRLAGTRAPFVITEPKIEEVTRDPPKERPAIPQEVSEYGFVYGSKRRKSPIFGGCPDENPTKSSY